MSWSRRCWLNKTTKWQVADRRYFSVGSMARVDELEGGEDPKELLAVIA